MKTELSSRYLNQGGWDLFMTVFSESHCAGHQCWHLHDTKDGRYNPEISQTVGNPIKEIYQSIDSSIRQLISEAGPDTNVFVLASHGMGDHNSVNYLLDDMLRRLETPRAKSSIRSTLKSLWHLLPSEIRGRLFKGFKKKLSDCSARNCFEIPNNTVFGGIRINVIGREPNGKIKLGADYDAFCEKLTQNLFTFINCETGKPIVKSVRRIEDLYPGEDTRNLPDLIVEWNRESPPPAAIYSPKAGTIKSPYDGCRTGDHYPNGMFFAVGPDVKPGPLNRSVSIMDFGPTLAELQNVTLPDVDGRSFASEIFAAGVIKK